MEIGLTDSVENVKRIEEDEYHDIKESDNENIDDIRRKIIEFMKSLGYLYTEGEREFDDEINDLFGKGNTLVEIAITVGIDNEVIKQIMEKTN